MYFVTVDSSGVVNGMYIEFPANGEEFSDSEIAHQNERGLIQLTAEEYTSVGPGYRYIDGKLLPPEPPTEEEIKAEQDRVKRYQNKVQKDELMSAANLMITAIEIANDAKELGIATVEEKEIISKSQEWKKYRILVNRLDPDNLKTFSLPEKPE